MMWRVRYLQEAVKDLKDLGGNERIYARKAIQRVSENPLPQIEGGYGAPLGNKDGRNLTGCYKIKLRGAGLRVVYKLVRTETEMLIIVVGARADEEVYDTSAHRLAKYGL